jgi:AraC-like DNA-binding protein
VETYRASSLPGHTRAAAWNEVYCAHLDAADLTPANEAGFDAELRSGTLGPLRVVRMSCGRSFIDRTSRHISPGPDRTFSFMLQVRGQGVFAHYGHEVVLGAGDITLCDSAAPHSYHVDDGSEVVMLRVPVSVLKEHLPSPELFCGRLLRANAGLTGAVAAMTLSLCAQLETGLVPDFQNRVAHHLLQLIATSYAMAFDSVIGAPAVVNGRHAQVKLYIEQHLRDPQLSPRSIAEHLQLSSRYLRMIFAATRETASAYILRRRLEECAREIADERWRARSITEIAFSWGFNSAPHFTRTFRARYGMSPRLYRRTRLGTAAAHWR